MGGSWWSLEDLGFARRVALRLGLFALLFYSGCLGGRTTLYEVDEAEAGSGGIGGSATGGSSTGGSSTGGRGGFGGTGGGGQGGSVQGGTGGSPDFCSPNPCVNGGECALFDGSYVCRCPPGYGGQRCELDTAPCDPDPCDHGYCSVIPDGFTCVCDPGYYGFYCESKFDVCTMSPCQNGGVCFDRGGFAACLCPPGYEGGYCEVRVDDCDPNPCENGGKCENLPEGGSICFCPTGFTGDRCENPVSTGCQMGDVSAGAGLCRLTTVCGMPPPTAFAGGDCSFNTDEFADWWCQLGGYSRAAAYTEVGTYALPALYYSGFSQEVLCSCAQVKGPTEFGFSSECTGVKDLICFAEPISNAIRVELMVCGTTSRDVATFIPPGQMMVVAQGCYPTEKTQALLVSRTGAGSIDAANLRRYLHEGGIVITEYTVSDDVWNLVFPYVPESGALYGSCLDNVPTVVQYSPGDQFWLDNEFRPISASESGCGYSVAGFPFLTPLAGWDFGSVGLGYRNLGMGRFWAADFDWQDRDPSNEDLPVIMSYLVGHRR